MNTSSLCQSKLCIITFVKVEYLPLSGQPLLEKTKSNQPPYFSISIYALHYGNKLPTRCENLLDGGIPPPHSLFIYLFVDAIV